MPQSLLNLNINFSSIIYFAREEIKSNTGLGFEEQLLTSVEENLQ